MEDLYFLEDLLRSFGRPSIFYVISCGNCVDCDHAVCTIVLKTRPVTKSARPLVHGSLVGPLVQTGLMLVF
jgi:hypothetical protein